MINPDRNRRIAITLAALAVLAGTSWWTWNAVRHARRDLVTLTLRNAPLADALRRMASQTRERIAWDDHLQGTVSADFVAVPLAEALVQVAEQVGAFSQTIDAVHRDAAALDALQRLLAGGGNPEASNWTNPAAAPDLPGVIGGPPDGGALTAEDREALDRGERRVVRWNGPPRPGADAAGSGPGPIAGGEIVLTGPPPPSSAESGPTAQTRVMVTDEVVGGAPPGHVPGRMGPGRKVRVLHVGGTQGPDGAPLVFDLSPERLLLHVPLLRELTPSALAGALPHGPAALAQACRARWTRLFALMPAPAPGLGGIPRTMLRDADGSPEHAGGAEDPVDLSRRAVESARRHQFERLNRLSPEQRAREAKSTEPKQP